MAGGDVASPSNATFTEEPAQSGGFMGNASGLLRKYWYVAIAIAILAGFLIYNYIRSSSAQVGTSSTTAGATDSTAGTTGTGTSTMPDASSILDLLSQSYQAMADSIQAGAMVAQSTATSTLPGAAPAATPASSTAVASGQQAAVMTQPSSPKAQADKPSTATNIITAITGKPSVATAGAYPGLTPAQARAAGAVDNGQPVATTPIPSTNSAGPYPDLTPAQARAQTALNGVANPPAGVGYAYLGSLNAQPSAPPTVAAPPTTVYAAAYQAPAKVVAAVKAAVAPIAARRTAAPTPVAITSTSVSGRRSSGNLAIGGPPPSGPTVPFGTHVATHQALVNDGTMYARNRAIRPE